MTTLRSLILLLSCTLTLTGCQEQKEQTSQEYVEEVLSDTAVEPIQVESISTTKYSSNIRSEDDSLELTQLIRNLYTWTNQSKLDDFPYLRDSLAPNIFTGIDWIKYDERFKELTYSNLFTQEFLDHHYAIAKNLDISISEADISERDWNDGIPTWNPDYNIWCGCQDNPDKYWEYLTIQDLKFQGDIALFNWTWDTMTTPYPHHYKATAKWEDESWKIDYLSGFDWYKP